MAVKYFMQKLFIEVLLFNSSTAASVFTVHEVLPQFQCNITFIFSTFFVLVTLLDGILNFFIFCLGTSLYFNLYYCIIALQ